MSANVQLEISKRPPVLPRSCPKVRLHVVGGPGQGQTVELRRCVSLIGSRPGCKLHLRSKDVSPVHCAVVHTGEEIYLRDCVSSNGTFLNELKAVEEPLEDGDTIRIGEWELRVEIVSYSIDTLSDLPHVTLEPEPTAFGVEVNGSGSLVKLNRKIGLVGRREGCDVVVRHPHVSRVHMLFFLYLGQPVFCDLLSHNSVALEQRRAGFGVLKSGDTLSLGAQKLRLVLPGIGRRKSSGTSSGSGSDTATAQGIAGEDTQNGSAADTSMSMGSTGGTVIRLDTDTGDRIDIRAAENSN